MIASLTAMRIRFVPSATLLSMVVYGSSGLAFVGANLLLARELPPEQFALFTLLVALLTAAISGLAPALQACGADLTRTLKDGGRGGTRGPGNHRLQRLMVVFQLTLALVLTVGAALMTQGFQRMGDLYQGLDPQGVLTLAIRLPEWHRVHLNSEFTTGRVTFYD